MIEGVFRSVKLEVPIVKGLGIEKSDQVSKEGIIRGCGEQ